MKSLGPATMQVAICIGTFNRRDLLRKLLTGVAQLAFRKTPAPEITVIVVDNDAERSAEYVCNAAQLPWPIKYVVEPRRGIARVRNRAVFEAGNVDFIAFLDDDEVPTRFWLDELLWILSQFEAQVVAGPVITDFAPDVPGWIRGGKFFDKPTFESGYSMDKCSTNNVLIRREIFDRVPSFNEDFALTGAEDTHFFIRVKRAGYKIVWARDAVVHEAISTTRANFGWLLRRGYQLGNSWSLCELSLDDRFHTRLVRLLKAVALIAKGLTMALISPFRGRAAAVWGLREIYYGVGQLSGMAGHKYQEYRSAGMDSVEKIPELARRSEDRKQPA
jgi:succinoglycan biosynthesis protein ExoM